MQRSGSTALLLRLSPMSSLEEFARAIERGDSSIVESLISHGAVDVNARLPREFQPPALVYAAERGQRKIVDILLRADARVDDSDEKHQTPCHAAAALGHHDVLAVLLAHRPNLALNGVDGRPALYHAMSNCEIDGGRGALMLLEAGASLDLVRRDDLCRFAVTSTAAIQVLLDRGFVVDEFRDYDFGTLLHIAARHTHDANVFEMLVNVCGVDLEERNDYDRTCAHVAADCSNVSALRWLVNAGANLNCVAHGGTTPLQLACDYECTTYLLAAGADTLASDSRGRTALFLRAAFGR